MIKEAAIKDTNGTIYTGHRHDHAYAKIMVDRDIPKNLRPVVAGFVTEDGTFLDRCEAGKHAFECGQIKELTDYLISEDLW